jgi:hypothetical protein
MGCPESYRAVISIAVLSEYPATTPWAWAVAAGRWTDRKRKKIIKVFIMITGQASLEVRQVITEIELDPGKKNLFICEKNPGFFAVEFTGQVIDQ